MTTYTSPTGNTPQGQQLAQGQPNAVNSVPPPGSPSSAYPSDQALNQKYADANANSVSVQTPETRQSLIANSNIPAMQNNFDDVARKLFEYDSGILAPQFQGQNPGTPGDAASFGRVDASPLGMTMQAAGLPASQGVYNPNPKYAYTAQTSQADSLSSLLDTLNKGISDSFGLTKNGYAQKVSAAQSAIDNIIKLMTLKQDALSKEQARANSGGGVGSSQQAANTFEKIKNEVVGIYGDKATETNLFDYINQNQGIWKAQGIDTDEVWQLFHQYANAINNQQNVKYGGLITGKGTKLQATTDTAQKQQATKQLYGDLTNSQAEKQYGNKSSDASSAKFFKDLKKTYPELSDSVIKTAMKANGWTIVSF